MENSIGNFFGNLFPALFFCSFISIIFFWYYHIRLLRYLIEKRPDIYNEYFSIQAWFRLSSIANIFEKKFYLFSDEWKHEDKITIKYINNSKMAFTAVLISAALIIISFFLCIAIFMQIESVK